MLNKIFSGPINGNAIDPLDTLTKKGAPVYRGYCVAEKCCKYTTNYANHLRQDGTPYMYTMIRARTLRFELDEPDYKKKCDHCNGNIHWMKVKYKHGRKTL